ncbi:MAG: SEL1-like repeat protein [Zymomonas mobilis]
MKRILWAAAFWPLVVNPVQAAEETQTSQIEQVSSDNSIVEIQKAAEADDAKAQLRLAAFYSLGQNVPQDYKMAAFWYQKAAD